MEKPKKFSPIAVNRESDRPEVFEDKEIQDSFRILECSVERYNRRKMGIKVNYPTGYAEGIREPL